MIDDHIDEPPSRAWCAKNVHEGDEMSHSDIAQKLGISVREVKEIEKQAMRKLRQNPDAIRLLALYLQSNEEQCD